MRSWLYTPANTPSRMIHAALYGSDGVVYDLEDAIAEAEKDEARLLISSMLPTILSDVRMVRSRVSIAVRVNGFDTPHWRDDIRSVVVGGGRIIRLPKVEGPEQIEEADALLNALERELKLPVGCVHLHALLENPTGIEAAFHIVGASPRLRALGFGAEDYCAALGIHRKGEAYVLDYPRSRIANAAASLVLEAYDAAWGYIDDEEGLEAESLRARSLGMHGKSAIHPDQIDTINRSFSFSSAQIDEARSIIEAMESGGSVATQGGRMVDRPVIRWANAVLAAHEGNP